MRQARLRRSRGLDERSSMRVTGTVKWFDLLRGVGLIGRGPDQPDCFVHHSAVRGTVYRGLATGQLVEFTITQDGAAAVARDLIRLGGAPIAVIAGAR